MIILTDIHGNYKTLQALLGKIPKEELDHFLLRNQPNISILDICNHLYEDLENSKFVADIRASYEKETQSLKDQIETLQKTNMELSEALTNGIEYLEDKDHTGKACDQLVKPVK